MQTRDNLPLTGIKVLELGHTVMGPTCGLILADMGAEVYKVEPTGQGDTTRHLQGFGAGFFCFLNRNKRSLAIDLKTEKGRGIFHRLVEQTDILIENYAPGTVERLGIGYQACKAINPRLIYCSLKGFMPGPYENRPALDEVVQMLGGLAYMTGPAGRPLRAGASVTDIVGGSYGALGILAALYEREQSGRGALIQSTLFESVAFLVGQHMAETAITGVAAQPMPERGRAWAIYDLFQTADGEQLFLAVTSERHWQRFCATFGYTDWAHDARLATNQDRLNNRHWFLPELRNRLQKLSKDGLMELAEKADIPFAPVNRPVDLVDDVQMNCSNSLAEVATPTGKRAKVPLLPLRMNGASFGLRNQPPQVGEGAADLLRSLGLSKSDIARLVAEGVIQIDNTP